MSSNSTEPYLKKNINLTFRALFGQIKLQFLNIIFVHIVTSSLVKYINGWYELAKKSFNWFGFSLQKLNFYLTKHAIGSTYTYGE